MIIENILLLAVMLPIPTEWELFVNQHDNSTSTNYWSSSLWTTNPENLFRKSVNEPTYVDDNYRGTVECSHTLPV